MGHTLFLFVLTRSGNIWHCPQEAGEKQKMEEVWGGFLLLEGRKRSVTGVALCHYNRSLDNLQAKMLLNLFKKRRQLIAEALRKGPCSC